MRYSAPVLVADSTQRLVVETEGWFDDFHNMPAEPGYLPNLGFTAYCSQPPRTTITFEGVRLLPATQRKAFDLLLFTTVQPHHLNSTDIAFWPPAPCWKCGQSYIPHSLVSKHVRCVETYSIEQGIGSAGLETVGIIDAEILYAGIGKPLALMPYGIEYLDKMLANTWRRMLQVPEITAPLAAPLALLAFTQSDRYGAAYWALHCPHCSALQGEHFLKPHPELSNEDKARAPLSASPVIIATPTLDAVPVIGGKLWSRVFFTPYS